MTPEFIERVRRDYDKETNKPDWESYLAGYWAGVKRFGTRREERRNIKSKLGYSRIGLGNV
jgi:hypothetical protein